MGRDRQLQEGCGGHQWDWSASAPALRLVDNKLQVSGSFNVGDRVQLLSKSRLVGIGVGVQDTRVTRVGPLRSGVAEPGEELGVSTVSCFWHC